MKNNNLLSTAIAGSLLLLSTAIGSDANAFAIVPTGGTAGNPAGDLYKVTIASSDIGQSFQVNWLVPASVDGPGGLPVNLLASSTWTLNSYSATSFGLSITINNETTGLPANTNAAILSFGFGVDPNSTASFINPGAIFDGIETQTGQQQFPGGFKQVDVCVFAFGCTGGNVNDGLQAGASDSVQLGITPNSGSYGSSVDLLFFPIKFQTTWDSFEPAGTPLTPTPPEEIPEPNILLLLAAGLAGLGIFRKYQA